LPAKRANPTREAKRRSSYQSEKSLSMAMKVTETPSPVNVRPMIAHVRVGARAKRRLPAAAMKPPATITRFGPRVSARIPVGSCISV